MFKRIRNYLDKYKVDGSRISILGFEHDKEDLKYTNLQTIGYYDNYKNMIEINPELIYDNDIELICCVISHEFLHMLLEKNMGNKTSIMLDNICSTYNRAYVKNGGI